MEIYKFEIHTSEEGIKALSFLNDSGAQIIGGIEIQHFRQAKGDKNYSYGDGNHTSVLLPHFKVELFTSSPASPLLKQLSTIQSVFDVRMHPCESIDLPVADTVMTETVPAPTTTKPESNQNARAGKTKYKVENSGDGSLRLKLESPATPLFLLKASSVFCQHNIDIQSGRKFRQGTTDYATFTIPKTHDILLGEMQDQLKKMLDTPTLNSGEIPTGTSLALSPDQIEITLQDSGSLPALKVVAECTPSAFRYTLYEALSAFNLDISIARMTSRGNRIEDTYHIKATGNTAFTVDQIELLKIRISGK